MGPYFTIFTPTYNRARLLPRTYQSLIAQTASNLEWVIVDDGSDDNTEQLVEQWIKEAPFRIVYKKQGRCGRYIAINRGVELASGFFFVNVDSDDWLTPDALETFAHTWDGIPAGQREEFATICGLCLSPDGQIITERYPEDIFDSNTIEIVTKYGVEGEKALATRTAIRRKYPFPENLGRYCMCSLVSNRIALSYKTRFVNVPLLYKDFQVDGTTRSGIRRLIVLSPQAFRLRNMEYMRISNRFISEKHLKVAMSLYLRASFQARIMPWRQFFEITHKLLWLRMLPRGLYQHLRDLL